MDRTAARAAALLAGLWALGCAAEEETPERPSGPAAAAPEVEEAAVDPFGAPLVLLSGPRDGTYHALARGLAGEVGAGALVPAPTSGSVATLDLLAWEQGDLGLVQADVLQSPAVGVVRRGVEVVRPLFLEEVHVLVRQDAAVEALSDLAGARVAVGLPGAGSATTAAQLFRAAGLEPGVDVTFDHLAREDALAELRAGAVAAVVAVGGAPVGDLGQASWSRLLPLSDELVEALRARNANYRAVTLAAGTYPWLTEPAATVAVPALLVKRRGVDAQAVVEALRDGVPGDHPKLSPLDAGALQGDGTLEGPAVGFRDPALPLRIAASAPRAPLSGALRRALGGEPSPLVIETAGDVESFSLVSRGAADLALVQADLIDEALRLDAVAPLLARLRLLAPLHPLEVHLVTPSGSTHQDLAGLRLGTGALGSGPLVTATRLVRLGGYAPDEVEGRAWPAARAVEVLGREVDAVLLVGPQPLARVPSGASFVPLPELLGYAGAALVPESYGWLEAPVPAVATRLLLVGRFDLTAEEAAAAVRAVFANRHNLAQLQPRLAALAPATLEEVQVEGLPLHAGAQEAAGAGLEVDSAPAW